MMRPTVFWLQAAIYAFLLFLVMLLSLQSSWLATFDRTAAGWIEQIRSPAITALLPWLGKFGDTSVLVTVYAIVFLLFWFKLGWRREAGFAAVSLLGAYAVNTMLKQVIARARPQELEWLVQADGYSFPSGNAMVAASFYSYVVFQLFRHMKGRHSIGAFAIMLLGAVVIVLAGSSRLYAGIHYTSDILAGYGLGLAFASVLMLFTGQASNSRI